MASANLSFGAWFSENDPEGVAFEYPVKAVRRED
jgi:hypothetical protein